MSILKEFPAYAGMKTSDSGGRTVIDKFFGTNRRSNVDPIWDSGTAYTAGQYVWFPDKNGDIYRALEATSAGESPDTHSAKWDSINAEWAGNDRPEKHQTLNGKYQACVEKEATNLITDGQAQQADDSESDWDLTSTTTLNYDTVFGRNVARHERTTSAESDSFLRTKSFALEGNTSGRTFNYSVMIRNNGGVPKIQLEIRVIGGEVAQQREVVSFDITNDFELYNISGTIADDDRTGVEFYIRTESTVSGEQTWDIVAGLHMPIESAYPVLFTEGTRPAPLVPIDNFLMPEQTIGIVVDFVATYISNEITQFVRNYDGTDGILMSFGGQNKRIEWSFGDGSFYNATGGSYMPESNERERWAMMMLRSPSNQKFVIMNSAGNIHVIDDATERYGHNPDRTQVVLGSRQDGLRQTSVRLEQVKTKSILSITDEEIKQFFENLTTGTSMATKKENMTIV